MQARAPMKAQPLLIKELEMLNRGGKSESPDTARCLSELGRIEVDQANFAVAIGFLKSAAALADKGLVSDDRELYMLLDALAICYLEIGQVEEAAKTLARLVALAQRLYGHAEPETAQAMEKLGDAYASLGEKKQAEAQYHFALQIFELTGTAGSAVREESPVDALRRKLKSLA